MSLDARPAADARPGLAGIENEISTYRAISPMAIASFVLGLATLLVFADLWFLVAAVLAVVAGLMALRKIHRMSDVLTGAPLARAGIAMALVFGLSALTMFLVQSYQVQRSASRFASGYVKVLAQGNLANAAWYRMPPDARKTSDPRTALEEMRKNSADAASAEVYTEPIKNIFNTLLNKRYKVRFVELERSGFDRLTPFAFALIELIPPEDDHATAAPGEAHDHAHESEYAMIDLRGSDHGNLEWMIQDIIYPYTRNSAVVKEKPIDDGHGH